MLGKLLYDLSSGDGGEESRTERLLARLCAEELEVEEARGVLEELRDVVRESPGAEVGEEGMAAICDILEQTAGDPDGDGELIAAVVDVLQVVLLPVDGAAPEGEDVVAAKHRRLGRFLKRPASVTCLLDLLDGRHGHVVILVIMFLRGVLGTRRAGELQHTILNNPRCVDRILEKLTDARDFIRNEVLLLLEAVADDNPAIQNIIAFNQGFEKLLGIVEKEGLASGDRSMLIVVEDCLRVVATLLRGSESNQRFFGDSPCVDRVAPLLRAPAAAREGNPEKHAAQLGILLSAVGIVGAVAGGLHRPSARGAQDRMVAVLEPLLTLAADATLPLAVRTDCLRRAGQVIDGHAANQARMAYISLAECTWRPDAEPDGADPRALRAAPPLPVLHHLVDVATTAHDAAERGAAEYCLACFLMPRWSLPMCSRPWALRMHWPMVRFVFRWGVLPRRTILSGRSRP